MPSSVIRSYQYYPGEQRLRITYLSGAMYDYLGVPAEVYAAMNAYQSKGTFLNREIKGHYPFKKVL
jgi:KTSC domain